MTEYIVCPLCGRNRVIKSKDKGYIRWDYVDLKSAPLLQVRDDTGGRGSGFPLVASKTLAEISQDPAYSQVIEGMKQQLIRLVKEGLELGLLEKEDLP
jgi:hypothetical protein